VDGGRREDRGGEGDVAEAPEKRRHVGDPECAAAPLGLIKSKTARGRAEGTGIGMEGDATRGGNF
jgi:hypothetical protein